jgi:hypothetical protein
MKQTAVEWLVKEFSNILGKIQTETLKDSIFLINAIEQAKEIEKEQQLELIQFLADREDFKENSSISIFIAEDYLNQFKNK